MHCYASDSVFATAVEVLIFSVGEIVDQNLRILCPFVEPGGHGSKCRMSECVQLNGLCSAIACVRHT